MIVAYEQDRVYHWLSRSFKRCIKRGLDVTIFAQAIRLLQASGTLPAEYRPHKLSGKYADYWECHLQLATDMAARRPQTRAAPY